MSDELKDDYRRFIADKERLEKRRDALREAVEQKFSKDEAFTTSLTVELEWVDSKLSEMANKTRVSGVTRRHEIIREVERDLMRTSLPVKFQNQIVNHLITSQPIQEILRKSPISEDELLDIYRSIASKLKNYHGEAVQAHENSNQEMAGE